MAKRELFGTDGVRGAVGEFLTAELAQRLGRAAASASEADRPQVLVIRDTRESGPMLEAALAAGIASGGGDALLGGVLPSPAASVLTRRLGFDLAAVVSASHNPYADNGIKFFGPAGRKLDDDAEAAIEARLDGRPPSVPGNIRTLEDAAGDYLRELRTAFPLDLSGRAIALDCANGATHRVAPAIFRALGAEPDVLCDEPDGRNINDGCGATAPERLARRVKESGAEIGFAFDGDGDRVMAVDGAGEVRDGDELIALAARHLSEAGDLHGGVAVTVMTNYGFHQALGAEGIELAQTRVGDRYVIDELAARDWRLGGEQSGHVIWTDFAPTGDGIAAALLTLRALGDRKLADVEPFPRLPQRLENVRVADRSAIEGADALWAAVREEDARLAGRGRVLVRASGTEPLLRVMVEAPDDAECEDVCSRLVAVVERELG
ncbi:MAG: phosphoglucosamine mutase [Solirubrobacterales bacterium]